MNEFCYLLKVFPETNNNRYYRMTKDGDIFLIEMGRVGAAPVKSKRPISLWESTRHKKLEEGYVDRSDFVGVQITGEKKYADIKDKDVDILVHTLMEYANRTLDESYTVSYRDVSKNMVEGAQDCIWKMDNATNLDDFNAHLLRMFEIIPRKMKNVHEMMAKENTQRQNILHREQELLDIMRTKLEQEEALQEAMDFQLQPSKTILDVLGLSIRTCNSAEEEKIKHFLTEESSGCFKQAFRVHNKKTDQAFHRYCKKHGITKDDIHFHYHGSKNMNYMGLISEGIKLNPKAPINGKMFGYGLYFATRAKKSMNYTNLKGSYYTKGNASQAFLAVYKVAYQNPYEVDAHCPWMQNIRKQSEIFPHDALYAHAGVSLFNDEIIVYREDQVTLQYLIELEK